MCSIGWLKLKNSWIFYKNRDRAIGDPINKENIFIQDQEIAGLGNKKLPGLTIAINKYGIGITTAKGPKNQVSPEKKVQAAAISEQVLRESKSLNEAKEKYIKLAKNLGQNYNVIIVDAKQAIVLEITPKKLSQKQSHKFIARTNHFTKLIEYNTDQENMQRSNIRLKKLIELIKKVKSSKDMISVLKSHSNSDSENICRHNQWTETCASAFFWIKENEIIAYYLLNKPPCKGEYIEKIINF